MNRMLAKLRCRVSGHPLPGGMREFAAPIRQAQPRSDLPYLKAACPRCGVELHLHFIPGAGGMNTPAHAIAMLRAQLGDTDLQVLLSHRAIADLNQQARELADSDNCTEQSDGSK